MFSHSIIPDSEIPRTAPYQASLSFTIPWSLLRLTSIKLVVPSNHLHIWHAGSTVTTQIHIKTHIHGVGDATQVSTYLTPWLHCHRLNTDKCSCPWMELVSPPVYMSDMLAPYTHKHSRPWSWWCHPTIYISDILAPHTHKNSRPWSWWCHPIIYISDTLAPLSLLYKYT